ncbi:MAG: hypothetical protein IPK80_07170 [Nannocystis sp.]|nr:hypothetical protein [Nannocystis sp.]
MNQSALAELLRDLYPDSDEVRRLAFTIEPRLHHALPGELASAERVRQDLARMVLAHGLGRRLRALLLEQRPHWFARIEAWWPEEGAAEGPPAPAFTSAGASGAIHIEAPARGELCLFRLIVELIGRGAGGEGEAQRLRERRRRGLVHAPSLTLARVRHGLVLRAFPQLLLAPYYEQSTRELALKVAAVALYCPFGRTCAGPRLQLRVEPPGRDSAATVTIHPNGASEPQLRLRVEDLEQTQPATAWI